MLSSEDLARFYFQYQTEAVPLGMSLQIFVYETMSFITFFRNGVRIRAKE